MAGIVRRVELQGHDDARGRITVAEHGRELPFVVRRAYVLHETQGGAARGFHAHRQLHQLMVALVGGVTVTLDDGHQREDVRLDNPRNAILVGPGLWREMRDFTPDCVLLVLADSEFQESDYIRDRAEFLRQFGQA